LLVQPLLACSKTMGSCTSLHCTVSASVHTLCLTWAM